MKKHNGITRINNQIIVDRIKKIMRLRWDHELADALGISTMTLSSWKRSEEQLLRGVIEFAIENKMDINTLLYPSVNNRDYKKKEIKVLRSEDLYSYLLNPAATLLRIPSFDFPFKEDVSLAFQVISPNMEPALVATSYVLTGEVLQDNLTVRNIYVLLVPNKGIYYLRYNGRNEEKQLMFSSDNKNYTDYMFKVGEVIKYYEVRGVFEKF